MTRADHDIVIVGAGPYGLSTAAHLRARGHDTRVFGQSMSFWERQMPRGMLVRSAWEASSISDPLKHLSLDVYEAEHGPFGRPLPGDEFTRYGQWVQAQAVPDLDTRVISAIESDGDGFQLSTEDGDRLQARRVVVATGLRPFSYRPPQFATLEDGVATHTMDLDQPGAFAGQAVAVIGCGQSAVETAALLGEADAEVELIARAPFIRWLARGERIRGIDRTLRRILYAPTDVGPAGLSWIVAMPELFKRLPIKTQEKLAYRSIRPAATGWLMPRMAEVRTTFERVVKEARTEGSRVHLTLDDSSTREVDHVVLGTGYRIDLARMPVLGQTILERIKLHTGYPVLGRGFESSISGLHFVGAYSAWSYGPIMRFVAGTKFTGHATAAHLGAGHHASSGSERSGEAHTSVLDQVGSA